MDVKMKKEYELNIREIARWHTDCLSKYRIYGDVDEILKKGITPIFYSTIEGYVIPEAKDKATRAEYAQISGEHRKICKINRLHNYDIAILDQKLIESIDDDIYQELLEKISDAKMKMSDVYDSLAPETKEAFRKAIEPLLPPQKPPKQQKKTSYVWENNPDKELPELYNLMINEYKLIAPETTYKQFKAVFTGQPIDKIEPVKWHQDNASELLYFIDRLEQLNNIVHNPKRADYQRMTACFVKPDGKQFNAVWKSLKTDIEINLSQDKQKAIYDLVSNF